MTQTLIPLLFSSPVAMILVLIAIVMAAGSANAFNQLIDEDIDSVMERTKSKRPLPLKDLNSTNVFIFALSLGIVSTAYLWWAAHPMAASLSLATILFYTIVYTMWLKRRYYYNIVIGGAAGAAAPIIASAAVYGQPSLYAWIMFAIIFMWTPPHFWALALAIKDEYAEVNVPMLPNVKGDQRTKFEIILYTISLLPLTIAPFVLKLAGPFYLISSLLLWAWYMKETSKRLPQGTKAAYKKTFLCLYYLSFLTFCGHRD